MRASFPTALIPFEVKDLTLSSDPQTVLDLNSFGHRPHELLSIQQVTIKFTAPQTLNATTYIALRLVQVDGTINEILRFNSGTDVEDIVITAPDTGGLIGSGQNYLVVAVGLSGQELSVHLEAGKDR